MKLERLIAISLALAALAGGTAFAQMEYTDDVILPSTKEQGPGAITPYFWVGAQVVESLGYNLETGGFGLKDTGDTWASFNVAFVDSRHDTPKAYEVGSDPSMWTGRVAMKNYTVKLNSWASAYETDKDGLNVPLYFAEVQGKGFHFGMHGQAGEFIQTLATSISSGGNVLYFADPDANDSDYYSTVNPNTSATYAGKAVAYAGYTKADFGGLYASFTSEGNVDSTSSESADGGAVAFDWDFTPLGAEASEEKPLTVRFRGNALFGGNYPKGSNPYGVGAELAPSLWLADNIILTPSAAFDAVIPETGDSIWSAGGGLMLSLSGMRWVSDSWAELSNDVDFFNKVYENHNILKFAYLQAYGTFSKADDVDLALKFEEPDGTAGFSENLGAMAEVRLNNVAQIEDDAADNGWSAVGRVSYDLANHAYTPYARAYLNSDEVLKVRVGTQFSPLPHAGFEFAYTSRNLNADSKATGTNKSDMGRIEFIAIIKTDTGLISTPKRMSDWNY